MIAAGDVLTPRAHRAAHDAAMAPVKGAGNKVRWADLDASSDELEAKHTAAFQERTGSDAVEDPWLALNNKMYMAKEINVRAPNMDMPPEHRTKQKKKKNARHKNRV